MPRKSAVNELQAEEVATNSPRRSTRTATTGTPAGITTRRTSQTTESSDTPVRATRSRRASTQAAEETVDSKSVSQSKAEGDAPKETSPPARRGRKPSVTNETKNEETEKPKPVRGRRTSRANSEDNDEDIPQKPVPVRSRRNSANVEAEAETKITAKTPARTVTRRRSSAAEQIATEKVSTPSKRTSRTRRGSVEELDEDVKKPATRGRKKSVDENKIEEVVSTPGRRSRRNSTDLNSAPKTPARITRRSSITKEPEEKDKPQSEPECTPANRNDINYEQLSPIQLQESVKVTPLKKRKIIEKVEAQLDLSIINESTDDINVSNHDELSKEFTERNLSESTGEKTESVPSRSGSTRNSPVQSPRDRKRLSVDSESQSPLRKSPRLNKSPKENNTLQNKSSSPQKTVLNKARNLLKENFKDGNGSSKSFISSGSDDSFRIHLSAVSMANSSVQEGMQDNNLNTSNESLGSNKENQNTSKNLNVSAVIPVQEQIVVSRVSNVFKSNQKEYSFVEPMEVDECSLYEKSISDKIIPLNESATTPNAKVSPSSMGPLADTSGSEIAIAVKQNDILHNNTQPTSQSEKRKDAYELTPLVNDDGFRPSGIETEGSDNLVIEETEDTVDISVKHKKSMGVESPLKEKSSQIVTDSVQQIKVILSRKSSSPISVKRTRKSVSPRPNGQSSDSEDETKLTASKRNRKSKSMSPSPFKEGAKRKSKSKSPSSRRLSDIKKDDVVQAMLPLKRESISKSPASMTSSDHKPNFESKLPNQISGSPKNKRKSPVGINESAITGNRVISIPRIEPEKSYKSDLDQSLEKPKSTEEILVSNDRICLNISQEVEGDSCLQNTSNCFTKQGSNKSVSESTDQTDYITAVANTNNESQFTSILNSDNDTTQCQVKHSDSTHYDFDLPSDDDDLVSSKSESCNKSTNRASLNISENIGKDKKLENNSPKTKSQRRDQLDSQINEERLGKSSAKNKCLDTKEYVHQDSVKDDSWKINSSEEDVLLEISDNEEPLKQYSANDTTLHRVFSVEVEGHEKSDTEEPLKRKSFNDKNLSANLQLKCQDIIDTEEPVKKSLTKNKNFDTSRKGEVEFEYVKSDTEEHVRQDLAKNKRVNLKESKYQENNEYVEERITKEDSLEKSSPKKAGEMQSAITDSEMLAQCNVTDGKKNSNEAITLKSDALKTNEDVNLLGNQKLNIDKDIQSESSSKQSTKPKFKGQNSLYSKPRSDDETINNVKLKKAKEIPEECKENNIEEADEVNESKCSNKKEKRQGGAKRVEMDPKPHDESFEEVECKMVIKVDKPQGAKRSLDEFATAKLTEFFKSKAEEIENSTSEEEEVDSDESEYNEFIDGMAEEGEEDTPSELSNDIIDVGESIGSSDSELGSEDDYDQDDSFICDDDEAELLSGDEYDLSNEKKKKKKPIKSRIIDPDTLGDSEIIKIAKNAKEEEKPKKRSRIITVSDSSEDETNLGEHNDKKHNETPEELLTVEEYNNDEAIVMAASKIAVVENDNVAITSKESKIEETSSVIELEDSKVEDSEVITIEDSKVELSNNDSIQTQNISISALNNSLQKRSRRSSLSIQENILITGKTDPLLSKRINSLVESFCSTVKKGEISLNLSLEYEDSPHVPKDNNEAVHILSNVQICPSSSLTTQAVQEEPIERLPTESEDIEEPNSPLEKGSDLREILNKKKLKRRLSKSFSEVFEDKMKAKKRKKSMKKRSSSAKGKERKRTSSEELKSGSTFNLMNQLLTDVKNRPRRILKPSTTGYVADNSWIETNVRNFKPSTSPAARHEMMRKKPNLHPKDFKNQVLMDANRVKRVETKTLLKKKGTY